MFSSNSQLSIFIFFTAFEWAVRLMSFFVVPRNRKPSSATAWLMLIMLFPTLGLIIFLLLGSPKLNKRRRAMQKHMDEAIASVLNTEDSPLRLDQFIPKKIDALYEPIIQLNEGLSGFPVFSDNSLFLLDDYDGAIADIAKSMRMAKKFIHIEYFILAQDTTTEQLFVEIENAVQRGIKVRVLFDAIGSRRYPKFKEMKKRLTTSGAEWRAMLPLKIPGKHFNRPDLRNHRKIVVIDGEIGYTGSQNLIQRNYHRKDTLYYDELVVRVTGPIVLQLEAAFVTDWYAETGEILTQATNSQLAVNTSKTGSVLAQVLPSGPGFDNDNNLKLFTSLIHAAHTSLYIVNPYFVPDDSLMVAITSAAQRGVRVTMINSKIMDQAMVGYAQRSYFEELLKAGVKIYQYKEPILLHSKYMIIDNDISVIGSSNLDMRSFQLDLEVTLLAYDTQTTKKLQTITKQYLQKAQPLHLDEWLARPVKSKLFENLARLTSAVQ